MNRSFVVFLGERGYSIRSYSSKAIFINFGEKKIPTAFISEAAVIKYIKGVET